MSEITANDSQNHVANLKLMVARAQLGTATELFLRNKDEISVHVLVGSSCELLEGVNKLRRLPTFSSHILGSNPSLTSKHLNDIRRQYYNAFKHLLDFKHNVRLADAEIIEQFSDDKNDAFLFQGWFDYYHSVGKMPIEVQVFQLWCYAVYPDWVVPETDRTIIRQLFPGFETADRILQKNRLRHVVGKYRKNKALLAEAQTETLPLLAKVSV